ncbi:MAG: hypothetical protein Q9196_006353 [Gyalolechia fulgens]
MTPVRVRGKRGQKARLQALQEESTQRAASEESEMIPEPGLATLECLPTEILQRIFLFSQNVALPQASLTLGKALSSTYVKHQLLRALVTDPCMGQPPSVDYLHPPSVDYRIARLQTNLLRCRWVDLPSIKRAVAASMTSLLALLLGKPADGFSRADLVTSGILDALVDTGCPLQEHSDAELSRFVDDIFSIPTNNPWVRWHSYAKAKGQGLHIDPKLGAMWISQRPFFVYNTRLRATCQIPTRLLHGPWTDSKKELLEFLMCTGAGLDPEDSNNEEVAAESLKEAIVQGDASLVSLLISCWYTGAKSYRAEMPPSEEHLRLAIFKGGCKPEIIDLLGYCWNSIDWNQDDFVEWATECKARGDERGSWLLERIRAHEKFGRG